MNTKTNGHQDPFVPNYLLYLLAAASEAASARFHSHVRAQGLRVPEWRVLACLTDWDGSMVTELARYAMIEQSRLTKIIIQMDRRGLVMRRSDPEDGRRVRVFLTEDGRGIANALVADAKANERELLNAFQGNTGKEIKQTLRAMIERLESDSAAAALQPAIRPAEVRPDP
ncbi:MarR family winged helix-turn-helix transcriptional regulator [Hoeflea sp. BAL378]|uniref:MarR family winged helix-turn-helix transcriptional regulator n=1 Tax=Hoeflea sp. BAL378 TaxID=1547437 RepID=UPI00068B5189|nr:MarR family winged helix-turn-helix transcriptional regulator [Hoeflea sp. BAL378]